MSIDPTNQPFNFSDVSASRRAPSTSSTTAYEGPSVEDQIALAQIHNMVDQLISQPEVRESMVELGHQLLVENPQYPPSEVVEKVAQILSKAIRRQGE